MNPKSTKISNDFAVKTILDIAKSEAETQERNRLQRLRERAQQREIQEVGFNRRNKTVGT